MKPLIFLLAIFGSELFCETTFTQDTSKVNISIQPIWGPIGYNYVEYYYLPDIEMYYYVPRHKFIYMQNGQWISKSYLPAQYNLYNGRKVVLNEPKPYLHHLDNKTKYALSNEHSIQQSIRDSHEPRYFENKNHPEHSKWKDFKRNQVQDQKAQKQYDNIQLTDK